LIHEPETEKEGPTSESGSQRGFPTKKNSGGKEEVASVVLSSLRIKDASGSFAILGWGGLLINALGQVQGLRKGQRVIQGKRSNSKGRKLHGLKKNLRIGKYAGLRGGEMDLTQSPGKDTGKILVKNWAGSPRQSGNKKISRGRKNS